MTMMAAPDLHLAPTRPSSKCQRREWAHERGRERTNISVKSSKLQVGSKLSKKIPNLLDVLLVALTAALVQARPDKLAPAGHGYSVPVPAPAPTYDTPDPAPTYVAPSPSYKESEEEEYEPQPAPFDFAYTVSDRYSGADFAHVSNSDGNVVKGEYRVLLPDGRTQIVNYVADDHNGYKAEVTYEGEAKYPEHKSTPSAVYKAPETEYRAPEPEYQKPDTEYQAPRSEYQEPTITYQAPTTAYQAPDTAYQAPATAYQEPAQVYQAPDHVPDTYQTPKEPSNIYGTPN
ncbi:uncharacterized protein LOC143025821 [Oratosquilla oratoria]|uniref:uncharacterized protein LOC143025821 n=1 Tax=Oratosquilla oratoria TaxID=337810 RepID=UPI003F7749D9